MLVIPKHYSGLKKEDYLIYFKALLKLNTKDLTTEKAWGNFFGNRQLIPAPTGRHALWYFLESVELEKGSQVLIPAYNLYVIVRLIIQKGLVPVFVDIDIDTLCMDHKDLAKKITKKSKLVVVTHMFGNPANMSEIKKICDKHKILLFEDCAHAIATESNGKVMGTWGDGALFSFGIYKLINTFGGGLLVMSKKLKFRGHSPSSSGISSFFDNFTRVIFSLLFHPATYWFILGPFLNFTKKKAPKLYHVIHPSKDNPEYRFNSGNRAPYKQYMNTMIWSQIRRLKPNIKARTNIALGIKQGLKNLNQISLLNENKYGKSNFSYFGIYVDNPNRLAAYLSKHGIESGSEEYYDCSTLSQFKKYKSNNPNAKYASEHLLRLPNFLGMKKQEVDNVVEKIRDYYLKK